MHPTYSGPVFSFTTLTLLKSEKEPMRFSDVLYMISEVMMNFVSLLVRMLWKFCLFVFKFQWTIFYQLNIFNCVIADQNHLY